MGLAAMKLGYWRLIFNNSSPVLNEGMTWAICTTELTLILPWNQNALAKDFPLWNWMRNGKFLFLSMSSASTTKLKLSDEGWVMKAFVIQHEDFHHRCKSYIFKETMKSFVQDHCNKLTCWNLCGGSASPCISYFHSRTVSSGATTTVAQTVTVETNCQSYQVDQTGLKAR